jgi:hypothetical protein
MSGQISHSVNTAIGGNAGWSYSRQVGTGLAWALDRRTSAREASSLAHLAGLLSVVAFRGSGMSWRASIGWTAGLSLLFWALGRE